MSRFQAFKDKMKKLFAFQYSDETIYEYPKFVGETYFHLRKEAFLEKNIIYGLHHFSKDKLIDFPARTLFNPSESHYSEINQKYGKDVILQLPVDVIFRFRSDFLESAQTLQRLKYQITKNMTSSSFIRDAFLVERYIYHDIYLQGIFIEVSKDVFKYHYDPEKHIPRQALSTYTYRSFFYSLQILYDRFPSNARLRSFFEYDTHQFFSKPLMRIEIDAVHYLLDSLSREFQGKLSDIKNTRLPPSVALMSPFQEDSYENH